MRNCSTFHSLLVLQIVSEIISAINMARMTRTRATTPCKLPNVTTLNLDKLVIDSFSFFPGSSFPFMQVEDGFPPTISHNDIPIVANLDSLCSRIFESSSELFININSSQCSCKSCEWVERRVNQSAYYSIS